MATTLCLLSADDMLAEGALAGASRTHGASPQCRHGLRLLAKFVETPRASCARTPWMLWKGEEWINAVTRRRDDVVVKVLDDAQLCDAETRRLQRAIPARR